MVAVLGELLMGDGRPSGALPSLKIWERSDKKWGEIRSPILGFQITDNTCAIFNGKTLEAVY